MMTNKEAIEILDNLPLDVRKYSTKQCGDIGQAIGIAINALRPVSRERVDKVFPGCRSCKSCRSCVFCVNNLKDMPCKKCDPNAECVVTEYKPSNFCPVCGKPLTDEAVQMVMERLGARHEKT